MDRLASLRSGIVIAGLATLLTGVRAHAALELSTSMQALESANVATVVLVPPMAVFQGSLTPTGLQNNGCHYTTVDRAAVRALVALLQAAGLTANPVYQKPDVREGTYFTLDDGSKFSLLIADNGSSRLPVLGIAESTRGGRIESTSVSTRPGLSGDVRDWAKRYGGTGSGSSCDLQTDTAEELKAPPPVPR
jgi:hypothetical protein